ncbi:MAG TPA: hypothetical protein VKQ11_12895 [Candidatus Sulfotelmatobacter sp.]|nr:hypothetical protein [Candidatus Sulfotelmatobacter sp.]
MGVYKRTEITVETNEVLIVRRARVYRAWCPLCGREVDMVGVPDARAMAGVPGEGAGTNNSAAWHVSEDQETALVCLESVLKSI